VRFAKADPAQVFSDIIPQFGHHRLQMTFETVRPFRRTQRPFGVRIQYLKAKHLQIF
jgi:hypothetical protein